MLISTAVQRNSKAAHIPYTALGKCTTGGLTWGGEGGKIRSQCYLRQSLVALQVRLTSHTRHGTYNSWVGLRQPEGPDWHRRSTRVAVYIRSSSAWLPARSIKRSHSWRVRALAKWPRCICSKAGLFTKLLSLFFAGK